MDLHPQTSFDYEVITSPQFLGHKVRVKQNDPNTLGLDTVNQYTGFLDVDDDKHLFFWFFESRNDPSTDPIVFWLNGGPGGSSAIGLFFELGPSFINASIRPEFNPYSWNSNASVVFIDQPVGVGFSYSEKSAVNSTAIAGVDFYAFTELFFQKFPQFKSNSFHIAGESYGGHYIPKFASEILAHPKRSFNLTSVLIGNGFTDAIVQYEALIGMGCGQGGYKSILSEDDCKSLEEIYPKCVELLEPCNKEQNPEKCEPAFHYCESNMFEPFSKTHLNPFDIRMSCGGGEEECYDEIAYVEEYLNLEFVREALGLSSEVPKFASSSEDVYKNFSVVGDKALPHQQYVAELLDKGVAVLIYAGDKDYRCNWLGNFHWTDKLEYSLHQEFSRQSLAPLVFKGEKSTVGEFRNYDKFTFVRVYDAGHLLPHDQPKASLDMLNTWLQGNYAFA
ncbi:Alpha/Beta hydrolase protein [Scheffersomyces xylosifermentans]|uniref:Alpha/Beta hydrolase protein n=1 Tax=Scheffersomyces xylosifermentans TaxID=1304137 RepID=UPI00315C7B34